MIDLLDNVNRGNRVMSGRSVSVNFVKNEEIFRKFEGGGQDDGVWQPRKGEDSSVCQHRGEESYSVCQQKKNDDSVCQHKGGEGLVQKRAVWKHIGGDGHVWKQSVGRRADGVSVDDGNVIRQCVGLGDSDSVSGQRRGIGASMGVKGCDVLKL